MEEFRISRRAGLKALGATIGAAALGTSLAAVASAAPRASGLAMSTNDRIAYVNSLDLGVHNALARRTGGDVPASGPGAALDAGSLMAFTANVSTLHRSDALNSTLLAQLNSDKMFDRFNPDQLIPWYRNYTNVLSNVGWTMQNFSFEHYKASGSTFSVSNAVLEILTAVLSGNDLKLISATLNSLKNLESSNDPWYKVWDQKSHSQQNCNFQLSTCNDEGGSANTLTMRLSGYSLKTSTDATRFLWVNYSSSSTDLQYSSQTCVLNEDVYGTVRSTVIGKLGNRATDFVKNLDI
ncbi:MAG TPA: hypothetical protein VL652_46410 [Kutzneria sp.]|jgi:hypothetical protein|nr:hypothetical protein [Kutzneria sp.]